MRTHTVYPSGVAAASAAFFVAVALLAAGCDNEAGHGAAAEPPVAPPRETTERVRVFLLHVEDLVEVERMVSGAAGAAGALAELLRGPTEQDREDGLTTAIPPGTRLLNYRVAGVRAEADFSAELASFGGGSAYVLAITDQLTHTIMANDERVTEVELFVEGVPAIESLQP